MAAAGRSTAAAAVRMTSATAPGWDTMITCEPSTSVMVAPARSAMDRTTSVPAALAGDASTVQDGSDFPAGGPDGSENASSETGRWVAAITAACWVGRSAANTSWNLVGSIANSVAVPAPSGVGYCSATCAVERMLSLEPAVTSARRSPSSGANAATKTRPTTLPSPVAALEITAPPLEWPTARTGPGTCLMKLAT